MTAFTVINPDRRRGLVLTCEHATCAVPVEYDDLGLDDEQLREHIGWDVGASALTEALAQRLAAPAVQSGVSRLLIDCNRDLADPDLIVSESHGVQVPGNQFIDAAERERRIRDFYEPYHDAIDDVLATRQDALLLSVHSFTPILNGRERRFDAGVLFDSFVAEAEDFGAGLASAGLKVRYNQPYSGLDGLIFSARTHGMQHGLRYLELEVNNRLLREAAGIDRIATAVAQALSPVLER
ncbi:MAG TPA: N-formylglutamate amidohydrolase [Candidatus Margulisiibacteriota bacterium]|nr:N-formylglutamate amidohydrolase [Candidatus Margulisiibacteriota bacterium]